LIDPAAAKRGAPLTSLGLNDLSISRGNSRFAKRVGGGVSRCWIGGRRKGVADGSLFLVSAARRGWRRGWECWVKGVVGEISSEGGVGRGGMKVWMYAGQGGRDEEDEEDDAVLADDEVGEVVEKAMMQPYLDQQSIQSKREGELPPIGQNPHTFLNICGFREGAEHIQGKATSTTPVYAPWS
jgi:hypothetical protein